MAVNLPPALRKRIAEIDYQTAIANQGYLRNPPTSRIGAGREVETVRAHTVRAHTVPAHDSHRGATTYRQPAEHVREHTVHRHESHHVTHGGVRDEIAHMTARLEALEKRSHHRNDGHIHIPRNHVGGAVLGGEVIGGKSRKTDRPLNAYQEFLHKNLHAARERALASGLEKAAASREAFREVVDMWNASKP